MLLPANATGNTELNLKGAWRLSRGNSWGLFSGIVARMLMPLVLVGLVFVGVILIPVAGSLYRAQWAAASALATCLWLIAWSIGTGFLSHPYRPLNRT
ncbi:hypothetical protein OZ411_37325 [Bradyrhizobium sp. Arg237L]|uniref:hypothetical protein n=1 Tax=Bradyrhizobium sp. Arg237L TaxID=3003352 RepID=UPI00249F383E|nr:hypothetical protein [Bradyrhizobium sp. Arg237L]MDI4238470.1 hypothetical protein [Bradyrhizobium sp. Arg237L]